MVTPRVSRKRASSITESSQTAPSESTETAEKNGHIHGVKEGDEMMPMTPSLLKVVQLREELTARGLSPKGLKKDLVTRLEAALRGVETTQLGQSVFSAEELEEDEGPTSPSKKSRQDDRQALNVEDAEALITEEVGANDNKEATVSAENLLTKPTVIEVAQSQDLVKTSAVVESEDSLQEPKTSNEVAEVTKEGLNVATGTEDLEVTKMRIAAESKHPEVMSEDLKRMHEFSMDAVDESVKSSSKITTTAEPVFESVNEKAMGSSIAAVEAKKIVHVSNLVRPFALSQVRQLLGQFGNIISIWFDSPRANCYVLYAEESEAVDAVKHLDGMKWPLDSGSFLKVDFSDEKQWEEAKIEDLKKDITEKKEIKHREREEPEVESPLDLLFLQTKAEPCLYYLPNNN